MGSQNETKFLKICTHKETDFDQSNAINLLVTKYCGSENMFSIAGMWGELNLKHLIAGKMLYQQRNDNRPRRGENTDVSIQVKN